LTDRSEGKPICSDFLEETFLTQSALDSFQLLISAVTAAIGKQSLDDALENNLNEQFPADGSLVSQIKRACHQGIQEGWMCQYEAGGIRYGRVIKPGDALLGFSVDVVEMTNLAGPHHRHPKGEIDLILPLTETAQFDQHGAGWLVYPPDSAHSPTVKGGKALILYLLPDGKIEFTGN